MNWGYWIVAAFFGLVYGGVLAGVIYFTFRTIRQLIVCLRNLLSRNMHLCGDVLVNVFLCTTIWMLIIQHIFFIQGSGPGGSL